MEFITVGQRIEVAVGTVSRPRVLRWTTWWGRNDLRVSYLLITKDGGIVIDPVKLPQEGIEYLQAIRGISLPWCSPHPSTPGTPNGSGTRQSHRFLCPKAARHASVNRQQYTRQEKRFPGR